MSDNGAISPPQPEYNFNFGLLYAETEEDIPCNLDYGYKYGDITGSEFFDSYLFNLTSESGLCSKTFGFFARFNEGNDDILYIGDIPNPYIQTGSVDVSFGDGHTLSIPIGILSQQPGADPNSFYELITSVEITIDEYWSYGGTYNTETGERL